MTEATKAKPPEMAEKNDPYESLEGIARTAMKFDHERSRQKINDLLPIEKAALEESSSALVATGDQKLDKKYARIDLPAALASRRKQPGIPYPVPRFACFNVDKKPVSTASVAIRVSAFEVTDRNTDGQDYGTGLEEDMREAARRRVRNSRATMWFGTLFAGISMGVLANALWADYNWQPICLLVGAIISGLALIFETVFICGADNAHTDAEERITAGFSGVLPDSARRKAKEARADGMKEILLVCEVDPKNGWKRSTDMKSEWEPSIGSDPLIVGVKDGAYYLVDKFDLTPAENWLASEMSS